MRAETREDVQGLAIDPRTKDPPSIPCALLAPIEPKQSSLMLRDSSKATNSTIGSYLVRRIEAQGLTFEDFGRSDHEETIILKRTKDGYWDDGAYQEYADTPANQRFRQEVCEINAWLEQAVISFDPLALVANERVVDDTDRRLRRVFTQGRLTAAGGSLVDSGRA